MHCAYLINTYPRVSHSFIRREIRALERLGWRVDRVSIRRPDTPLPDSADREEQSHTRVILDAGAIRLGMSTLMRMLTSPIRFAQALCCAWRMGAGQSRLRHLAYLVEACTLSAWLAQSGAAHLHAHFGTNSTTVAMLCRILGGPPFSFTVHGPEEFDRPEALALSAKIAAAAFVVAISDFGRSQLCRWAAPEHWGKLHVVRCGVDRDFLDASPQPPPESPRLVCVGRLCEAKGQLLLLQACRALADRGIAFELTLVGDGPYREHVVRLIDALNLGARVRPAGWLSSDHVAQAIRGSRALVLPSFAEGLPVVLMEALALRRPVISTYVAGIPELVVPGENGWLVPGGAVDPLVDAMHEALTLSPHRLHAMGCAGAQRVAAMHDASREAEKLAAYITRAASAPNDSNQPEPAAPLLQGVSA